MAKKDLVNKKAIFLDRDGIIIHDPRYLHKKEQVNFLLGIEALNKLQQVGFRLVMVSNQSAVARGLMNEEEMWEIDRFVRRQLRKKGVMIKSSYYCPHHPDITGLCQCRKPKPGLFLKALKELNIDPVSSISIGDKPSDLEATKEAGIGTGILVKRNGKFWDATEEELAKIKHKVDNISEAVKLILDKML